MTTVAELIEQTRSHLDAYHQVQYNWLNGSIAGGATSMILADTFVALGVGSFVAIDDEMFLVRSVDATNKTLTVKGGMRGTTTAAHSDGALVEVRPDYPQFQIRRTLKQEIQSWYPRVFTFHAEDVTYSRTINQYALTVTDPKAQIVKVWYDSNPALADIRRTKVQHWLVTTEASGGMINAHTLVVNDALPDGCTLHVEYIKAVDLASFADADDLTTSYGLPTEITDIAVFGTLWRLLSGREAPRLSSGSQPEPRRSSEIPPGARAQASEFWHKIRDVRLAETRKMLYDLYGISR